MCNAHAKVQYIEFYNSVLLCITSSCCLLFISGVQLEYGINVTVISNNTLITVDNVGEALFCSTDREDCCSDEISIAGNWFLPNGSQVLTTNTQSLHITLDNQTVGLSIMNSPEIPTGIYHCEMMDRKNITHYLYAGIYPENEGIIQHCAIVIISYSLS